MHQIGIDETDDCFGHLGLTGQRFAEPCFDELVVTETAGDGKHHGKDGHNGQSILPKILAYNDGIHHVVELLKNISKQNRN